MTPDPKGVEAIARAIYPGAPTSERAMAGARTAALAYIEAVGQPGLTPTLDQLERYMKDMRLTNADNARAHWRSVMTWASTMSGESNV